MRTSFHHQPEAQRPKFFSYPQAAGRLPHLCCRSRAPSRARLPPGAWGNFFKILNHTLGLRMVARARREFAVAHGAQLPAERLLGDSDAELLKDPLRQIDQPPAHNAVDRREQDRWRRASDHLFERISTRGGWSGLAKKTKEEPRFQGLGISSGPERKAAQGQTVARLPAETREGTLRSEDGLIRSIKIGTKPDGFTDRRCRHKYFAISLLSPSVPVMENFRLIIPSKHSDRHQTHQIQNCRWSLRPE